MIQSRTFLSRLSHAWLWVTLQLLLTPVLLAIGLAWTRLPDKGLVSVALTLLIPLVLAISLLELQAGTMRKLADEGPQVKLVWGAVTLLVWIAAAWLAWALLDWCDYQTPLWAGYLNSKAGAHARARVFTYVHIIAWLTWAEWFLRWIAVPAVLIPAAAASAQYGWRLPVRSILRVILNWRWWLAVVAAALAAVLLPNYYFDKPPTGTVHAQEWHVILKLVGTYLLAILSWVLSLAWQATLAAFPRPPQEPPREEELVGAPLLGGPPNFIQHARPEYPGEA